jgi:hypothetical protein
MFGITDPVIYSSPRRRLSAPEAGRFKNMLIENDAYLLQLSYYIHRNPLRARIVKRLASHRWSS